MYDNTAKIRFMMKRPSEAQFRQVPDRLERPKVPILPLGAEHLVRAYFGKIRRIFVRVVSRHGK